MTEIRTYPYKTVGTLEIAATVYRQAGTNPQPAVLWIHGGALIMGSRLMPQLRALFGRLLRAGCTVVSIDYRLAPETPLAGIVEDIEDAFAWVRAEGPALFQADPGRIAAIGFSAGAYLALAAGFRVAPRPKALVSFYGYGDITGPWYTEPSSFYCDYYPAITREQAYLHVEGPAVSGAPDAASMRGRPEFYLYCRQNGLWPKAVSGHDPAVDPEWFRGYEPLRNITPDFPPTLLLHGERDTDVPHEQSVLMAEAFRRENVAYDFVTNPDWDHGFDSAANDPTVSAAIDRVMSFLASHLG
jgi:acetyl esterase/lipase